MSIIRNPISRKKKTFEAYTNDFLQKKRLTCSPYTLHSYRMSLQIACRYLGKVPLAKLRQGNLDDMYQKLLGYDNAQGRPYALVTVRHIHTLVRMVLGEALREGLVGVNIADRAHYTPPRGKRKDPQFLEAEEARQYIRCALTEPDLRIRCTVLLLLYTGMRREELCGLQWKDIDFAKGEIWVRRACVYISGKGLLIKEPKNDTSMRMLKADPLVFAALISLKGSSPAASAEDRILTRRDGTPIHPDTAGVWLRRFAQRYGLRSVTPHKLRHTYATLQIFYGTDIRTVADCMGHSTPSTTLNIYSHQVRSAADKASNAMSKMLNP